MTTIAEAFVRLEPDTSGFERSAKSRFGKIASVAAKAFAGAFVVKQAFDFFKDATLSAEAYASQQANTRKIIEQTGGAANVTQGQVAKLTKELQNKTGVDDKVIQQGTNILLTFKNIANEAGRGNDIFDRTNSIMLDLAAVTGTSATSAATQLGKALNDPVKGITALQRVGVSFTEQQKDQIARLVESGDTLKAQKLILRELESQYGGTAEASADSSAKIAQVWEDAKERIGAFILPILDRTATFIVDNAIPTLERFFDYIGPGIADAVAVGRAAFTAIRPTIATVIEALSTVVAAVRRWFGGRGEVSSTMTEGAAFFRQTWRQYGSIVADQVALIREIVRVFTTWFRAFWARWGDTIVRIVQIAWTAVREIVRGVLNAVEGIIETVLAVIRGDWRAAWEGIKKILDGVWDAMFGIVRAAVNTIREVIGNVLARIGERWRSFWTGVRETASNIWGRIVDGARNMRDAIGAAFEGLQRRVAAPINWIIRNVINNGIIRAWNRLVGALGFDGLTVGTVPTISVGAQPAARRPGAFYTGGAVFGDPGRDNVPAWLTAGEHVLTRREVEAFGGHGAVERMRAEVLRRRPRREEGVALGYAVGGAVQGLKPGFLARLRAYSNAINTFLTVVSGYRSYAQQAALYAAKPGLAAPPGRSLHQLGIAADLSPQLGGTSRGNPVANRFGLTYPMSYEPWHIQLSSGRAGGGGFFQSMVDWIKEQIGKIVDRILDTVRSTIRSHLDGVFADFAVKIVDTAADRLFDADRIEKRAAANGFVGTVRRPTQFLTGEAGAEDVAVVPHSRGGLGALGGRPSIGQLHVHTTDRPERIAGVVADELVVREMLAGF